MKLRPNRPWPAWFGALNLGMFLLPPFIVWLAIGLGGDGWSWLLGPMAILMCISAINTTED